MSHLKRTLIEAIIILILVGSFGLNMYCRGKRAGKITQEHTDRRENVEKARKARDFEAIDKEWER